MAANEKSNFRIHGWLATTHDQRKATSKVLKSSILQWYDIRIYKAYGFCIQVPSSCVWQLVSLRTCISLSNSTSWRSIHGLAYNSSDAGGVMRFHEILTRLWCILDSMYKGRFDPIASFWNVCLDFPLASGQSLWICSKTTGKYHHNPSTSARHRRISCEHHWFPKHHYWILLAQPTAHEIRSFLCSEASVAPEKAKTVGTPWQQPRFRETHFVWAVIDQSVLKHYSALTWQQIWFVSKNKLYL